MLPNRRRSAYDVYRENAVQNAENELKNGSEPEPREEEVPTKSMSKITRSSKKAGSLRKSSQNASAEQLGSKSHGQRILSKANKLRRSLHMSGKKKKRARSMAATSSEDAEKENEDSESESPIPEKKGRSESTTANVVKITNNGASSSAASSSTVPRSRPVSTYSSCSIGSTTSTIGGHADTEAEKLMKWLISPIKPKKFFR